MTSLLKRIGKASSAKPKKSKIPKPAPTPSDDSSLGYDLITQLTYMTNVALGGASRDVIFDYTVQQNWKTIGPFRQVFQAVKRLNMEYGSAFSQIARETKSKLLKSLLLRFSGALGAGDSEVNFIGGELRVESARYEEAYERSLESLRKWGDAYSSLLVSVTLIIVIAMVSTMISDMGPSFILMLVFVMIMVNALGVYLIYRVPPREEKVFTAKSYMPPLRRKAFTLFYYLALPGFVAAVVATPFMGLGIAMLIAGFTMIPAGVYMYRDDARIDALDSDLAPVIRSLGATAAALGGTVSSAISKVDRRAMGNLEPYIDRLNARLINHISPKPAWERMIAETGSDLVNRSLTCFLDPIELGAAPDVVSGPSSDFAMRMGLLRARRVQIASTFAYLVMPLHFSMVGLLLFIYQIVFLFNEKIAQVIAELQAEQASGASAALPDLPYFQVHDLGQMGFLTLFVVLILTLGNGAVPIFALGGHPMKGLLYLGITCIMSGICLVYVPQITSTLLPI